MVSVITPSFNHAIFLRRTIESVFAQDYPNVEHIVVDGGSTDGTVELLREYGERFPARIRWVSEPDNGQSDALNKGIAMARGEMIGWQNSDDFYLPNTIGPLIRHLIQRPELAAVYGACQWVDVDGKQIGQFPAGPFDFARLVEFCTIPNQSAFVRKDALLACGGINVKLHFAMDYDLWLRLGIGHKIEYLPGSCGAWRLHEVSKSHSGMLRHRLECVAAVEHVFANPSLPVPYAALRPAVLQRHIYNALLVALAAKENAVAADLLQKAREADSTLGRWRYFTGEILARRFVTSVWFGFPEPEHVERVPVGAIELLQVNGLVPSAASRQMIACHHVFQALGSGRQHRSMLHVVRHLLWAGHADGRLIVDPVPKVVAQILYYGNRVPVMMNVVRLLWRARAALRRLLGGQG
jgi:hypothetical protein